MCARSPGHSLAARQAVFYSVGHTGVIFDYEVRQQRLLQVCVCVCVCARARARALQVCVSIVYYEVRQQRLQQVRPADSV